MEEITTVCPVCKGAGGCEDICIDCRNCEGFGFVSKKINVPQPSGSKLERQAYLRFNQEVGSIRKDHLMKVAFLRGFREGYAAAKGEL